MEKLSEKPDPEHLREKIYAEAKRLLAVQKEIRITEAKLIALRTTETMLKEQVRQLEQAAGDLEKSDSA